MSLLPFPPATTSDAIDLFRQDVEILHEVVHGDENAEVLTDNGLIPSVENVIKEIQDRTIGVEATLNAAIANTGLFPAPGSFEAGGMLTEHNQYLQLENTVGDDIAGGYSWGGALPKTVSAGSTPATTGGTPEDGSAWVYRGDATVRAALADGSANIAGFTAAQVAEAADIAIGNFVTPEQFFTGDINNPDADWLSAVNAAQATGRRILLRRIYGLSAAVTITTAAPISGLSRKTTGFKRLPATLSSDTTVLAFSKNDVTLSNFMVDGNNIGEGTGQRCNGLSITGSAKRFNITSVDAYDCTGYGHVTFGVEANPQIEGVYNDCYSENCGVLFEQIGALDVSLYSCNGLGVAGRTTDIFHPYAGSKRVRYFDCHGFGAAGGGITAITTNGHALGPFEFIGSSINIVGTTSAVVTGTASGAAAPVTMIFHGGSYKTSGGQSATLQTNGIFKAFGTEFDGPQGFNCPASTPDQAVIELHGCAVRASQDNATGQVNAIITNGCVPKLIGGSVSAFNTLAGGRVAVLGAAVISRETTLLPAAASQQVSFLAESAGVVPLQTDAATLGFQTINLPINSTRDKIVAAFSLSNNTDAYLAPFSLNWSVAGGGNSIVVRISGVSPTNLNLHYRIGVLP